MVKVLFLISVVVAMVCSQTYTQTSANVKVEGRTLSKSVLFVDCPHTGDAQYTDTGGVNITTLDYYPQETIRGLLLTGGTGNIGLILVGGGRMVIPVTVEDGTSVEMFRGWQIKKIITDATSTFTGRIFPLF